MGPRTMDYSSIAFAFQQISDPVIFQLYKVPHSECNGIRDGYVACSIFLVPDN